MARLWAGQGIMEPRNLTSKRWRARARAPAPARLLACPRPRRAESPHVKPADASRDDTRLCLRVRRAPSARRPRTSNRRWCPQGCAVSKRFSTEVRELFVADSINGRVVVYDASTMDHIRTFGERGSAPGQLMYPSGIAVPAEGGGMEQQVFVSELGNNAGLSAPNA